ncbi:aconitate hydratase AcnA [Streptomyces chiangmaiensis]|uniref:Aconitate hydratase n=1 Tax=Streptomyces chiangmaiensis TaxID=766497 RepID=A0ABU7FIN5_9ACTN|nr:aconitate hydratase AcnA [Streptomyces chiangmaiensis]MED7823992.1 aconitate hydratase AcnA [Streptomyces chiangmaiensis]
MDHLRNGVDGFGTVGTLTVSGDRYAVHRISGIAPPDWPYTIKVLLENLLRHASLGRVTPSQIESLLGWGRADSFARAVDIHPTRAFLHDTNGVPALADLAALRTAVAERGGDPAHVNPVIPVELTVDHSIVADIAARPDAAERNVALEYERNAERFRFLKWGRDVLRHVAVVPPGTGIMHQVNLEYLARVIVARDGWAFPDLCLGTDSHTTMIGGLGTLGWGIGGIEAEAAMLGQPLSMLIPPVVGVRLDGELPESATATDLVLTITELLRGHGVVGKFVEFYGLGVARLSLADRATLANMAPEYGATCGYFPIDEETLRYLRFTGRTPDHVALVEAYAKEQGLWHRPDEPPCYTETLRLDLSTVVPSLAGPSRPQDRMPLDQVRAAVRDIVRERTGAAAREDAVSPVPYRTESHRMSEQPEDAAVVIAAITSCTNTANPSVMVGAGLLARNAVERGLRRKPWVKTSLSLGSRVVTDYLGSAGLTPYLEKLGFHLTGYGCMTCIGASGPLVDGVSEAVREQDLTVAAVLSGNRNFEGRIHPDARMNFLASPPLVVAYALAGTVDTDLTTDAVGTDRDGHPVFLRDIWPTADEIREVIEAAVTPDMFTRAYADVFTGDPRWALLDTPSGELFDWPDNSTYLLRPPFLDGVGDAPEPVADIRGARVLASLGDSVTTDHLSPAGAIPGQSPAGRHLTAHGTPRAQLNTYASRRGNHEVMMRGALANIRLRNRLIPGTEGGLTRDFTAEGAVTTIHDAAAAYRAAGIPHILLAGKEYGTGSSRDWAAKGPALLGVRAVLAESFERIHRSNLVGMGILPLQFLPGDSVTTLKLTGEEVYDITGLSHALKDDADASETSRTALVHADARTFRVTVRLDTPRERTHYRHGGILPYVMRDFTRRTPLAGKPR